ncbi:hypothetical protein D9M70_584450 [compost metagenome]
MLLLKVGQATADLVLLGVDPAVPALFFRTQEGLVAGQHGGIHDGIGQGRQGQAVPACGALLGDQRVAHMLQVEVFADHPAVEQHVAVVQAQGRDLASRVGQVQVCIGGDRAQVDALNSNPVGLPGFMQHHHDLSHKGRGR